MRDTTASLPPGPRLPRRIQRLAMSFWQLGFIEACRRRYRDLATVTGLVDSPVVMIFDPDLVMQVFRAPAERLRAGEANAALRVVFGERSVFTLDGPEHQRQRRLLSAALRGGRIQAYEAAMLAAADREIESWPVGEPFALLPSMRSLTLDVILEAVFGVDQGLARDELKHRLQALLTPSAGWPTALMLVVSAGRWGGPRRRFEERRRLVDIVIYEEIARRRAAPDLERRQDVLSLMLLACDEDDRAMTDEEVRDQLITMLVAGHETTAGGLAWAFDLLLRHPAVLVRLQAELADGDGDFLNAVVKETLRIRPPVVGVVPRRVVAGGPYELGGYLLPPGSHVSPAISAIHRRPDRYPDPDAFRPDRFLGPDAPDAYSWLPFGGGPRRCLGAGFATYEMAVVIGRVLERTRLAPVGGRPERPHANRLTVVPKTGTRVIQVEAPRANPVEASVPDREDHARTAS
ncbi:MAG: cytochrome P450 [Solirubrobacteraceae bacterium]